MACAFYNKLDQVRSGDVVWRGDGINNVEYRLMNEFVKADDSDVFAGKRPSGCLRNYSLSARVSLQILGRMRQFEGSHCIGNQLHQNWSRSRR